jgi:DNA-binding response OmpR family regulator
MTEASRRKRILVIDDSPIVCETVAMMLDERGYDVITVDSIFAFSQALRGYKPDLALVDVMMPAMKGDKIIELSRELHGYCCPMVLFSDREVSELERLADACGAAGFIKKTANAEMLALSVARHLAKPRT